jgi:3-hydroxyisobutyrate dehydrogenase
MEGGEAGKYTVTVLGTGIMGRAIARNAARGGCTVRAWSRPLSDAEPLAGDGVDVCQTAAEAVRKANVVVTMAPDAEAIESFAEGDAGFLPAMPRGAVWVQSATVGVEPADRLIALGRAYGIRVVDAPVLGSKIPAEAGQLVILASGEDDALGACQRYFDAVSRTQLRVGEAGKGSRLKIVLNCWITSAIAAIAEALALAEALGVAGSDFQAALEGTAMDMGYVHEKGEMMLRRTYSAHGLLRNGVKDAELALAAARQMGMSDGVIGAAARIMREAADMGYSEVDMAAAFEAVRASSS